jgi:hypothetical protein
MAMCAPTDSTAEQHGKRAGSCYTDIESELQMESEDESNQVVIFQTRKRPGRPKNDDRVMVKSKVVKGTANAVVVQHYADAQGRQGRGWVEAAPRDSRALITAEEKVAFLRY